MNQDDVTRAREKARRSHLTTVEWVQCWCSRCNGAWETPRNEKAHMKRERSRAAQIGIPASNLAGPSNAAMSPQEEPRGSPSQSNPSSSHPNSPPAPSSSHATPLSPRDQEQFDDGAYEPPTPPGRPSPARSLSNDSLHSDNFLIRHDSPGVQNLIPAAQRDDNSDGNVSDLAAGAGDFEVGNQADFFADLLDRREPSAEPELELGNLLGLDGANSPDGSELGIDNDDYGIPDVPDAPDEQPRFDFDEDLELELEPGGPGNEPDPEDNEPEFAAFNEPDVIRNAYVDAFVQKTRFGATHEALKHQLKSAKRTISANPNISPDDLQKMAQTIRTAEKRLGISTSDIITTFPVCPICERRYNYEYIADADSNICVNEGCAGVLFTDKILASGNRRRVPGKTYPTASLKAWLQCIVLEPGKSELLQNWRTRPDDHEPNAGPISADEWKATLNPDAPLGDITDGYAFRERHAGMERVIKEVDGEEKYCDIVGLDQPVRFASLPFGLSLSMNTDWFQATKEGNYSVGAVYFVINNLPRHIRFLRENICLAAILPGPKEPSDYALDQLLEPIVTKLLELHAGVEMRVRSGDPAEYEFCLVHADLCHHIADTIARIKLGGGAGVASEANFCLWCRSRLSSITVPDGFIRKNFPFRNPDEDLNNAFFWRSLESDEDRRISFEETGNRFTILHLLPGWHTSVQSPPDAMHLLYLGGVGWLWKQIIVGPNLLAPRQPDAPNPVDIFNSALENDLWLPYSVGRLPPKIGQTNTRIKADQLKLLSRLMFVLFYLAMRDGDNISEIDVSRGTKSSTGGKHQIKRAKLLCKLREKWYTSIQRPDLAPTLAECFPSRNLPCHYRQILRFAVALSILDSKAISFNNMEFAQDLLETLCVEYTHMNIQLSPNFHYMQHLADSMFQTASLYNTHVWSMERANGIVAKLNHNGKGKGVMEGTLMRGWWEHVSLHSLIRRFEALPNRTPADEAIIDDLLAALRGGPKHAQQPGSLMAFIAQSRTAYARMHGVQEQVRLSNQSRTLKMDDHLWRLVVEHCDEIWPDEGLFGLDEVRDTYLPREGAVRNYSYVEYDAVRYGSFLHTSGRRACYGYINGRQAVRIDRVLGIEIPGRPDLRTACAVVRYFQAPEVEPDFPWRAWQINLGADHWEYNQLGELVVIPVSHFSGIFALMRVPMSHGEYWVTIALNSLEPEEERLDENDGEWVN